jgi:hypothetical protein
MRKLIFLSLVVVLSSCGAAWNLQKSKEHLLKAIAKGAKVAPDTVWKYREVKILVPAEKVSTPISPVIDVPTFDNTMEEHDGLLIDAHDLEKALNENNVLNKEKAMAELAAKNKEIARLKGRIANGFAKDTVYHVPVDSITTVTIVQQGGLVRGVTMDRKEVTLTQTDKVASIVNNLIKAGLTNWQVVGLCIFMAVVFLIIGYLIRVLQK